MFLLIKGGLIRHVSPFLTGIDFIGIMTAFLLLHFGEAEAGIFAFFMGLVLDVFSAGMLGLFTFLYLSLFLSIRLGSSFFDLNSQRGLVLLLMIAIILKEFLFICLSKAFSLDIFISYSRIITSSLTALISGLIAPFIFYIFNRVNQGLMKNSKEA